MTDKKEKILQSALTLFAAEGFKSTSTSKIAKHAGVSEGLIFRHFGNKEGLLEAILKEGEERAKKLFADIVFESDPKKVIQKTLNIGLNLNANNEEANFWKLQYKIKWEVEIYGEHKIEPLERALTAAFEKLGYDSPVYEARLMLIYIDGIATRYFLQEGFNLLELVTFLQKKYKL